MKKFTLIGALIIGATSFAQDGLPSNPEPGKCYVKCVSHDEFENQTEKIMVTPEYKQLTVVPATYKWVEERVLVKEASKKMIYHPATYKTVEVPFEKKQGSETISVTKAVFGTDSKTVEVFPKTVGWEYTTYSECASSNPDDCQVLCFKETPAKFEDVSLKTLTKDAATVKSPVQKQNSTYKKQVIDRAAYVEEIEIPATYAKIKKQVVDKPATVKEKVVPATYKTVQKQVLTKQGGISTWESIDCGLVTPNELDILWDLNSAKLTSASRTKIDNVLLTLLNDKKNISIELSSHTDSRGSDEFNRALSQRRADAIKNYLISKGISSTRLVSKGYGETRLKNNCGNGVQCSSSQHQANRRTEYKVLGNN